ATTLLAGLVPALRSGNAPPQGVLIAAGLFARSMQAAQNMDLGFTTKNLLMAQVDLGLNHYDSSRAATFQQNILERVRGLPGARSATLAARIPFGYSNNAQKVLTDAASPAAPDGQLIFSNIVSTDYFRTTGPTVVRGREFTDEDNASSQHVAVINAAMAEQLWPGQDPIGKTIHIPNDEEELRVV